jgi:Ca-activated chloride channel family protein
MEFVHPWVLLLLSLVPLLGALGFWLAARSARRLDALVAPSLQPRLVPPRATGRIHAQIALLLLGTALLLVALARPRWGTSVQTVHTRSRNVLVALDVSRSMLARDVHPNRLERAKVDLLDLIRELHGDRAGLLVFRGKANLLCPLTTDSAFLRQVLDGVTIDSAPRGSTDLALAIRRSLEALEPALDAHNAILLISDGEELTGSAVDAAREAGKRGVPIFTVGLGDPAGASIPEGDGVQKDASGAPVTTRLVESTLSAIARESGGAYVPLATAGTAHATLGSIYRQHLRRVAAREQQETQDHRRIERYTLFLVPAILLFCIAGALSLGRFGKAKRAAVAALGLCVLSLPGVAAARPPDASAGTEAASVAEEAASGGQEPASFAHPAGREGARAAQALYRQGDLLAAAEAYLDAARGVEADEAALYRHNAGVAYYEAGDFTNAAAALLPHSILRGHERDAELFAACQYQIAANAGTNLAAKVNALEQSAAGFQAVARLAPEDERRQRNLARLVAAIPPAREEAHIAEVLARHGGTPPDRLLERMLREQRALYEEAPAALTNAVPAMIPAMEALAERQKEQADLWIPLKEAMLRSPSITNAQQQAWVAQLVEQSRDAMRAAASQLRDLDGRSIPGVAGCEPAVYGLWRQSAPPPPLLDEAIALQTNALVNPASPVFPLRPDQPEAAALMTFFGERFPGWADQMARQAQADTNAPSLSPEDRAEIERLLAETLDLHRRIAEAAEGSDLAPDQSQALANMLRIRELLPKQDGQGSSQPPPSGQESEPNPDEQPQPEPRNEESQEGRQPQPQDADPQEESGREPQPQEEGGDEPPPEVQEMLRRVLQREKDHENEKRRRNQTIPMRPDERDW